MGSCTVSGSGSGANLGGTGWGHSRYIEFDTERLKNKCFLVVIKI